MDRSNLQGHINQMAVLPTITVAKDDPLDQVEPALKNAKTEFCLMQMIVILWLRVKSYTQKANKQTNKHPNKQLTNKQALPEALLMLPDYKHSVVELKNGCNYHIEIMNSNEQNLTKKPLDTEGIN